MTSSGPLSLVVMRHAKSAWDSGALTDHARPLAGRGRRDAPAMAQWLRSTGITPEVLLSSSARRTVETAAAVLDEFDLDDTALHTSRGFYHCGPQVWLAALQHRSESSVLICGHNPGLDDLVVQLAGHTPPLSASAKLMTTAAMAVFECDDWATLAVDGARLVVLRRPR